jgi:hypothetical protein
MSESINKKAGIPSAIIAASALLLMTPILASAASPPD